MRARPRKRRVISSYKYSSTISSFLQEVKKNWEFFEWVAMVDYYMQEMENATVFCVGRSRSILRCRTIEMPVYVGQHTLMWAGGRYYFSSSKRSEIIWVSISLPSYVLQFSCYVFHFVLHALLYIRVAESMRVFTPINYISALLAVLLCSVMYKENYRPVCARDVCSCKLAHF